MTFLTTLALRRRSVTILSIAILLGAGIYTYRILPVELFPEIEFPLVTIVTFYPSSNPTAVVRDVTIPIENAIAGMEGLDNIQSTSSENLSLILANFKFGTAMAESTRTITNRLNGLSFPLGVQDPKIARVNPDEFPVMQLSILSDQEIPDLQRTFRSLIEPAILGVDGVLSSAITGGVDEQILLTVDQGSLFERGLSLSQIAIALQENTVSVPAGTITRGEQTFPVRVSHTYDSLKEIGELVIASGNGARIGKPTSAKALTSEIGPTLLSDVAEISRRVGPRSSISRTNGRQSLGIAVIKDPDANTIDVTEGVLESLSSVQLPSNIEIVTIVNDGPEIKSQIDTLQREAILGFLFAMVVVFIFLVSFRPTVTRGLQLALRPTAVIGLSIPLSLFIGILFIGFKGMSLNFMTLGGLAISVGRVVDDSIVVLENVYRHIQRGEDRFRVALDATKEVAPAITASTLATIAVFVPLGFIQGLVGSFFVPFALAVSFALIASLIVALTAVPVLGAIFVRPGDIPQDVIGVESTRTHQTWIQRAYTPFLLWSLRNKVATLAISTVLTIGSLGLLTIIPITLFPSGGQRFISIDVAMPSATSIERTLSEVVNIENLMDKLTAEGIVDIYLSTVGSPEDAFSPGASSITGGISNANLFVGLTKDAPTDITERLRGELSEKPDRMVTITEISDGPPISGLEVSITGSDYESISKVAGKLTDNFSLINGIVNVRSNVAQRRDEIIITLKPESAVSVGLSARQAAFQVSQYLIGQRVTQANIDGVLTDVVLKGRSDSIDNLDKIKELMISGPLGSIHLGEIAEVAFKKAPVTISHFNGTRSATITGSIIDEDTQAVGAKVQAEINSVDLPAGVKISTGGIFSQIRDGFQDIFIAMGVGVVLVYLVMAVSLGALRNPFVIIMSLPLALIGTLASLAITGRSLGLPAMMGVLLLIGIVVTNAVVLVSMVEQLRQEGMNIQNALIEGGRVRLRPILMTAFTTSIALLPLAVMPDGGGGIIGAEMATVVIGGLMTSTFLTLLVVPVVYAIVQSRK